MFKKTARRPDPKVLARQPVMKNRAKQIEPEYRANIMKVPGKTLFGERRWLIEEKGKIMLLFTEGFAGGIKPVLLSKGSGLLKGTKITKGAGLTAKEIEGFKAIIHGKYELAQIRALEEILMKMKVIREVAKERGIDLRKQAT